VKTNTDLAVVVVHSFQRRVSSSLSSEEEDQNRNQLFSVEVFQKQSIMDGSPRTSGAPGTTHHHHQSYVDAETKQLRDHQQSREELLSKVHGLKNELQDWRYKMDGQVKNYRGELSSLKETLANEVASLRKELEETSERLKNQILVGDNDRSPAGRLLR